MKNTYIHENLREFTSSMRQPLKQIIYITLSKQSEQNQGLCLKKAKKLEWYIEKIQKYSNDKDGMEELSLLIGELKSAISDYDRKKVREKAQKCTKKALEFIL